MFTSKCLRLNVYMYKTLYLYSPEPFLRPFKPSQLTLSLFQLRNSPAVLFRRRRLHHIFAPSHLLRVSLVHFRICSSSSSTYSQLFFVTIDFSTAVVLRPIEPVTQLLHNCSSSPSSTAVVLRRHRLLYSCTSSPIHIYLGRCLHNRYDRYHLRPTTLSSSTIRLFILF